MTRFQVFGDNGTCCAGDDGSYRRKQPDSRDLVDFLLVASESAVRQVSGVLIGMNRVGEKQPCLTLQMACQ